MSAQTGARGNKSPHYFLAAAVLIMLGGLWLRVWNLGGASLWTDEVTTAVRAQSSLHASFKSILNAGNQTPFYFMALRLLPNASEVMLRLPSALLGLIGIALLMAATLRLYRNYDLALWAGLLLALNPYHVWLSRTARAYTLIFVLSLTVSYCFLMLLRGKRSRLMWITFTVSSMLAYFTHYTTFALPATQVILFVLEPRQKRDLFRRWMVAQALAVAPVLIWLYALSQNLPAVASEWIPMPHLKDFPMTLWSMTVGYSPSLKWYVLPGRAVVVLGMLIVLRKWNFRRDNLYWLWLIVTPLVGTFLFSLAIVPLYVDRYFMVFLPALILLIAQGLRQLVLPARRLALAVLLITSCSNILITFRSGNYQRDDWRDAVSYVAENAQAGDGVMVERDNTRAAFLHYYQGGPISPTSGLIELATTPNTGPFEQSVNRVWVIYRNPIENIHRLGAMPKFNPFEKGMSRMGDWLALRRTEVVSEKRFNGVTVLLLDIDHSKLAAGEQK